MHFFLQKSVPTNQNLLYETEKQAKLALVGDLDMHINEQGLIYNAAFDESKVFYGQNYDNCQYNSLMFSNYINSQIEWILPYIPQKSIVVEVGCGKGFYAENLASKRTDCQIYGFDSSYSGEQSELANLHFYKEYYNENYASIKPNFVISRHVIEHTSKPSAFLKSIRKTMQNGAMLFLETPDTEWILKNNVIYDFFYEHCSYFTENSLANILSESGFEPIEIKKEFGEQYMWFLAKANDKKNKAESPNDTFEIKNLCKQYAENREKTISAIKEKILVLNGKYTFIWGAGAKGVTFVNIFDPQKKYIKGVIDINPSKQGKFIAKTGHSVISPANLVQEPSKCTILLLNENYYSEIKNMLCQMNINCDLEIL